MSTNEIFENKVRFLLQRIDGLTNELLPSRLVNGLKYDHQTIFSSLRMSKAELLRMDNVSRKSIEKFSEFLASQGFKIGDTKAFMDENESFFYSAAPRHDRDAIEKEIVVRPISDHEVTISAYKTKIIEFLHSIPAHAPVTEKPSLEEFNRLSIVDLFPEEARQKLPADFLAAVANRPDVIKDVQKILARAVQKDLGFDKT